MYIDPSGSKAGVAPEAVGAEPDDADPDAADPDDCPLCFGAGVGEGWVGG